MTPVIMLGAIVVAPIIVLSVLRINAVMVFLSLCLGSVMMQFIAPDANSFLTIFTTKTSQNVSASDGTIKLLLLLLPVVVTAFVMIRTVRGGVKRLFNLLPAAGVGLLGALLVVPILPPAISANILTSSAWSQLQQAKVLVVGISAIICLLSLALQRPKHHGGEEAGGKKSKG